MARMNISIPDALYERLDRLRDRVNASRVCANALKRELDMIEGGAAIADPDIARLVQRLQTTRQRWYQRGREDGKRWAVEVASRQALWRAHEALEGEDGGDLAQWLTHRRRELRALLAGFDLEAAIDQWSREDRVAASPGAEPMARGTDDHPRNQPDTTGFHVGPRDETDETHDEAMEEMDHHVDQPAGEGELPVDMVGYMEGWRDILTEIWRVVSTALR